MLPDPQWVKWMWGRLFGEQENEEFRKEGRKYSGYGVDKLNNVPLNSKVYSWITLPDTCWSMAQNL